MDERILYWGSGSPPAWRVRLYLEERQMPYKSHMISFQDGDLSSPEMLALNPRGLVPILVEGDMVLYESLAIISFLEEMFPVNRLTPSRENKRLLARALVRMNEVNNASAHVGEVVYYLRRTKPEDVNSTYLFAKRDNMYAEVALWERYLDHGDCFLAGKDITVADICFFPTLAYMVRLGFELSRFPRLRGYYSRMIERPAVKRSWPPHWLEEAPASTPLQGL